LDKKQKELFVWLKLTRLRYKSGGCETKRKVAVEERVVREKTVGNKSWIGLNNVERMDKNGMTHAG